MIKDIIGRRKEITELQSFVASDESEFIAVYGRRRIGKTFLVRKILGEQFSFYVTGMDNVTMDEQLLNFTLELRKYSGNDFLPVPDNWMIAFDSLIRYLEKLPEGKKILFIDEIPWMDTPRSSFLSALEHFWNAWASARDDIKLIVCGSATSWMLNKLINNRGGLHNRLTHRIALMPFTLSECEEYFAARGFSYSRKEIAECYMVMGGVPYYLKQMDKGLSVAQNIDRLFFEIGCALDGEFDNLYRALFKYSENYIRIVDSLAIKAKGLTRQEIIDATKLPNNGGLTSMLSELETCGFIRRYEPIDKVKKQSLYQLVDFYTLFYFHFIRKNKYRDEHFWTHSLSSTLHRAWSGYAFKMLCLAHDSEIKMALGISGIQSRMASWRSVESDKGAQIDLLIDRSDMTVNLCEMKYCNRPFTITKKYEEELQNKVDSFIDETKTHKSIMLTLITTFGIEHNEHSGHVQKELTLEDLFTR
jgi:hypothetical protein